MAEFRMPSLGADMEAGTLVEWKVKPGDRITRGDIIAEVETDKGVIEVEVFEDGIVEQLLVQPETQVPVGTLLATIRSVGAAPVAAVETLAEPRVRPVAEEGRSTITSPPVTGPVAAQGKRLRASPLARKLAAELGIDLSTLQGSGPDGAIERIDVERAAAREAVEKPQLYCLSPHPRCHHPNHRQRHRPKPHLRRCKPRSPPSSCVCAAPSLQPWRAPTARSHITTWKRVSI